MILKNVGHIILLLCIGSVYCTLLDAIKAFDWAEYCELFNTLLSPWFDSYHDQNYIQYLPAGHVLFLEISCSDEILRQIVTTSRITFSNCILCQHLAFLVGFTAPFLNVIQPLYPWSTPRPGSFHRYFHHHECQLTCTSSYHMATIL